jgi:two-component system sensor histidine kinase AlgZ
VDAPVSEAAAAHAGTAASPSHPAEPPDGGERSIVRSTLRALVQPRRLVPVLLVSVPLVLAQARLSQDRMAVPLAVAMVLLGVLIAPVAFRVLFPEGLDFGHGAVRVVLYGTIGSGVVLIVGAVVPKILDMGPTLLTERSSLVVCAAMFLVAGWGLGRDIVLEASLLSARARAVELAREAERSQLLALRSHLDPHFLFNTLNAIAEWCREDGETAERAVLQLSSMLRTVLSGVRSPTWPLASELELCRTLFSLHLLRDPRLFSLEVHMDERLGQVPVPPMILLPIAENAVKHGPAKGHRGSIVLDLGEKPDTRGTLLCLRCDSPGPYLGPRPGSEGLPTLAKRLEFAYDGAARLDVGTHGTGTRVELTLPAAGPNEGA